MHSYANIFPHLLYTLLTGRPLVCLSRFCADTAHLRSVVACLSMFALNSFACTSTTTTTKDQEEEEEEGATLSAPRLSTIHLRRPVKLSDLKYCKLFGMSWLLSRRASCCSADSPECAASIAAAAVAIEATTTSTLTHARAHQRHNARPHTHYHLSSASASSSVDELAQLYELYVPVSVRAHISVLDLDKRTYLGPKYAGRVLRECAERARALPLDSLAYMHMAGAHGVGLYVRAAFLREYSLWSTSMCADVWSSSSLMMSSMTSASFSSSKIDDADDADDATDENERTKSDDAVRRDNLRRYVLREKTSAAVRRLSTSSTSSSSSSFFHTSRQKQPTTTTTTTNAQTAVATLRSTHEQLAGCGGGVGVLSASDAAIVDHVLRTLRVKQQHELLLACQRQRQLISAVPRITLDIDSDGVEVSSVSPAPNLSERSNSSSSNNNNNHAFEWQRGACMPQWQLPLLLANEEMHLIVANRANVSSFTR